MQNLSEGYWSVILGLSLNQFKISWGEKLVGKGVNWNAKCVNFRLYIYGTIFSSQFAINDNYHSLSLPE